jgi:hypothetical protein
METWGEDRQRNWGLFSGMLRGVSNPREGSKILFFLLSDPTDVQLAPTSPKLVEGNFYELRVDRVLRGSRFLRVEPSCLCRLNRCSNEPGVFASSAGVWRLLSKNTSRE